MKYPSLGPIQKTPYQRKLIPLSGRLITALDGVMVGDNFTILKNLRYTDKNLRAIGGMTKINETTALSSYPNVLNAFHFQKSQPAESHLLVHAWDSSLANNALLENITAIPATGDFESTAVVTPNADVIGRFSMFPKETMGFFTGDHNYIWGGNESECKGFINFNPDNSFKYDFTTQVINTINDANNRAILKRVSGALNTDNILCLHLDNNITDSSPVTPHTVTNNNVTFNSTDKVFGTHSAVFNGTTAYLSIPDNGDFDRSGGVWSQTHFIKLTALAANAPLFYQETVLHKFTYDTGSHEPTVGQTLYGEAAGVIVVDKVENTGGWGGAGTGTIYYTIVSGNVTNGEHIHESAGGAGSLVCNTTSAETDAGSNYIKAYIDTNGAVNLVVHECYSAGSDVVTMATAAGTVTTGAWYFIEITESDDTWRIFTGQSGNIAALVLTVTDTSRAKNYNGTILIGYDGSNFFNGKMDEYTCWSSALHSASFPVPLTAYGTSSVTYVEIWAPRSLKGLKLYLDTVNTAASSVQVYEWIGTGYSAVTGLTDGTATGTGGAVSLGQTGSISWDTTEDTSTVKIVDGNMAYVYLLAFTGVDDDITVYHCTINAPMQELVDIWDGTDSVINAFYRYSGSPLAYNDYTLNVYENTFDATDSATYCELDSLTSSQFIVAGFAGQQMALNIGLIGGKVNTAATVVTVYCSVDGKEWTSVGIVNDGTSKDGVSFSQSGTISWNPPSSVGEFMTTVSKSIPLYHYKLQFSDTLSSDVQLFYISGIPAQITFGKYKFPLMAQNRAFLCCDLEGKKHAVKHGAAESFCFFNGDDTSEIEFGESGELTGGAPLYSQFGASLYNLVQFFKEDELWQLSGSFPDWTKHLLSDTIGLAAPLTLKTIDLPGEMPQGMNRRVNIWQAATGIYMSDGRPPIPVHADIENYFDRNASECIDVDRIDQSYSDVDLINSEYHFFFYSGTNTYYTELVLDYKKWKWFEIDRTSGKRLIMSVKVNDTLGNPYNYGFISTGYMERLEYGNTFDEEDMTFTIGIGDIPLIDGDFFDVTRPDFFNVVMVANLNTLNKITYTHYTDTRLTGKEFTIDPFERETSDFSGTELEDGSEWGEGIPKNRRVANIMQGLIDVPRGIFHSGKLEITTNNEPIGFEPLALAYLFKSEWERLTNE